MLSRIASRLLAEEEIAWFKHDALLEHTTSRNVAAHARHQANATWRDVVAHKRVTRSTTVLAAEARREADRLWRLIQGTQLQIEQLTCIARNSEAVAEVASCITADRREPVFVYCTTSDVFDHLYDWLTRQPTPMQDSFHLAEFDIDEQLLNSDTWTWSTDVSAAVIGSASAGDVETLARDWMDDHDNAELIVILCLEPPWYKCDYITV